MAIPPRRYLFGGTSADFAATVGGDNEVLVAPNATLFVFEQAVGGAQITNLQDADNNPITELVCDSNGVIPQFHADLSRTQVWVGGLTGSRALLVATDLAVDLQTLDAAFEGFEPGEGTVTAVNGVAPDGTGDVTLTPASISAATATDMTAVKAIVGARLLQGGSGYPVRPTAAQFAIWIGASDPGSAALDGDIWLQPETA